MALEHLPTDPLPANGSEPLVPILRLEEGKVDPVALATWHEALSNTLAVEVSHDLMGLWLYPAQGGVTLLGPTELAEDALPIPVPNPYLKPEEIASVEKIVTDAGYGSATCLPVRFGKRDVALLLVADLKPDRYGDIQRVVLQCVAQQVAPMLGRIARQWVPQEGTVSRQQERIAGLLQAVAQANRDGITPQRFLAAVGRGLAPLLPHEHIELVVANQEGTQFFRLGDHPGGPLWADPSLVIDPSYVDLAAIFGGRGELLVPDLYEDERWPRGFLTAEDPPGADIRSLAGARLSLRGHPPAYMLVGSIGPDLYGSEDVELLVLLGGLILPQISEFLREPVAAAPVPVPVPAPARPAEGQGQAELLLGIAGSLAIASDAAAATRLIALEGPRIFPFQRLAFALHVADGTRVALFQPGERRATLIQVTDSPLGKILLGELPGEVSEVAGVSQIIVPLRGGGRIHGAMIFSAASGALSQPHLEPAQALADIVAPHVELLRRAAVRIPPYVPAWRRTEKA